MKVLYFTGTGNSLYVAKQLSDEVYSIPQLVKEECYEFEDEQIGIVFPTYFFGTPQFIEDFLAKVKLKTPYLFAIVTCGGTTGSVGRDLIALGEKYGFQFAYVNKVSMVDNFLPFFDVNKELAKEPERKIGQQIEQIKQDLQEQKQYIEKNFPLWGPLNKLARKSGPKMPKQFTIEEQCNGCGICAEVCPVDNIVVDGQPSFSGSCQSCFACTHNCPQNAIRVKGEKSEARYRKSGISLSDIIQGSRS